MKAAIITDTHWGVRGDSKQFLKFFDRFYSEVFFPYLKENNIKTIFHLGDIVDRRKFINYVTLHEFKRIFIQPIIDNGYELVGLVGNHDVPYRNTNEINAMKELIKEGNITFYHGPTDYELDGCSIALVPWINNTNHEDTMKFISETKSQVLFGHLELNGFEMHRGIKSHDGMSTKPFEKFNVVASGHFHHRSTDKNINYLGAPYEMTWNDYNDERGFHVFDSSERSLTFVRNPYRIFHKYWYDDSKLSLEELLEKTNFDEYKETYVKVIIRNKTNPYWFDIIMDNLYKANPANVTIVEDHKHMDRLDEDEMISVVEDTLTTLHNYVNGMNTEIDKNRLNQLFSNLYIEASNMDIA